MKIFAARRRAGACLFTAAAAVAGCSTTAPQPLPRTTVMLLPDEDGHVGAVTVSTAGGNRALADAYAALVVSDGPPAPAVLQLRSQAAVESAHADLLRAQPPRPVNFVLNFVLDSTALTPESKAALSTVIEAAHARKPTEITVFGHADASGTEERNLKLSADRARLVADILRGGDPSLGTVEVQYFGDKVPLIPETGHSPEPRNRRVEISIL